MLQPTHYPDIVGEIDEYLDDSYIKIKASRKKQHQINYDLWKELDEEQKCEIVEFAEREISNSIAKQMMKGATVIPLPAIGRFIFSHAKDFKTKEIQREDESIAEYYNRMREYAVANKFIPSKIKSHETAKSFAENLAKRKKHIL